MSSENTDFRQETLDLKNPYDVKLVRDFLNSLGFSFDIKEVEYTMLVYNLNDEIIGTGSYKKRTLKYVAVSPAFRETTAFAQVVTHLTDVILQTEKQVFVFTKPKNTVLFEGLGFTKIASAEPLFAALEFGYVSIKDYQEYLKSIKKETKTKDIATIVVNCNPFTNGHLYLIEKAAKENEIVYLFVVETEQSTFPFETRLRLIKEGISHLNNVVIVNGGKYVVSGASFPAYFLKSESVDDVTIKQAELDVTTFVEYLVPVLGITKRYIGTENYCKTTEAYNKAMKKILPGAGVEVIEIQRKSIGGEKNIISASKIREAIKNNNLESLKDFLPESTKRFLMSDESNDIKQKIIKSDSRH